jgi:hypothetical protein
LEPYVHDRVNQDMSRPTVFVVVLALHLGVLALLFAAFRTRVGIEPAGQPLELVFLAPVKPPKLLADNNRPPRLANNIAVDLAPPVVDASAQMGASSAADGHGTGVNWIAEAHRAVRAFEIRNSQTHNSALSVSSTLDERGFGEHHAGDRSKTESGDWIVWINADCYKIASWHSGASVEAISPQTICRSKAAPAHGD